MWHPVKGSWQIVGNKYVQQSDDYDCASSLDVFLNESFELVTTFEHLDGEVGAGFIFSSSQRENTDFAQMVRFDGNAVFIMGYFQNGEFNGTRSTKTGVIEPHTTHTLTLRVDRDHDRYSLLLDRKVLYAEVPLIYPAGYVGLQSSGGRVQFHHVTLTRLPMRSPPPDMNWVKRFTLTRAQHMLIPNERGGVVDEFSLDGTKVRQIGTSSLSKGQLHKPSAVALLDDTTLVITDRGSNQLHLFSMDGHWKKSSGWRGKDRGQLDEPVAVAVNAKRQIFVLERNNNRVQVFDETLHSLADFGSDKLKGPLDLALLDSSLFVVNTGLSQIECYTWNGTKATWRRFFSYGGGEGRGITVKDSTIYLSVVNEVRAYATTGSLLHSFRGRCVNFVLPQGMVVVSSHDLYVADYFGGRIVKTTTDLLGSRAEDFLSRPEHGYG
ncbi:MAG: hypothetical protein HYR76_10200 [Ignavibacteria bacterium]|nr:hypothetical protein [Ignavibacteria bacterium]MBI3766829.1 hypothetical protein [Ignavibacteriales bacterium]